MTVRDPIDRFRDARPEDPSAPECEAAWQRVGARVALLERSRGLSAARPGRARLGVAAAAVLLLGAGALALERASVPDPTPLPQPEAADPWAGWVDRALAGDPVARQRLLRGGVQAREALLRAGPRTGGGSLELLVAAGPLRGAGEVAGVAALLDVPELRAVAARLLAQDPRPLGPERLGEWAAAHPADAAPIVPALERVALQGRRESAVRALLEAGRAGSGDAAAAALRVGGTELLTRWLDATSPEILRGAACRAAVRESPASVRRLLLRRAERGEPRALVALAASGVSEGVPLWRERARAADAAGARAAVAALETCGGEDAHLALARALDGPAAEAATDALARLDAASLEALAARARRRDPDVPAALCALAVRGGAGFGLLAGLAAEARLRAPTLAALEAAADPQASETLARLARRDDALGRDATLSLGRRLLAGHPECAALLAEAARGPHSQAAEQALRLAAPAGPDAAEEPNRRPRAPPRGRGASPSF
jgi:hypothetical protein